jgi:hypothetical protein
VARQGSFLLLIAIMAAPAASPAAGLERWAFPAMTALVAGWFALRGRAPAYVTFCLWLFLLTPLVRRIADLHAGYSQSNVLMLAPYLAVGWAVLQQPRFLLARGHPGQWPFAVLFGACLYGFLLAVGNGRLLPGTLDLLRWTAPPLLACYIIVRADAWDAICLELRALTLTALPVLSLYGLYQFFSPPLWDAIWMLNVGMNSIGQPEPFEIRVFGTMNSPASLAYYLEALLLITLSLRPHVRWLNAALGIAALAVTLVRSAWLALAIGLVVFVVRAPLRVRTSVVLMLAAAVTLSPLALTNARMEKVVSNRIESMSNLGGDKSLSDRVNAYEESVQEVISKPWGQGFGTTNVSSKFSKAHRIIDGGPIEILISIGVLFGFIYILMGVVLLIAAIMRPHPATNGDIFSAAVAIAIVQALAFSSVTTLVGEIGILFWLAVGLLLASPRRRARALV